MPCRIVSIGRVVGVAFGFWVGPRGLSPRVGEKGRRVWAAGYWSSAFEPSVVGCGRFSVPGCGRATGRKRRRSRRAPRASAVEATRRERRRGVASVDVRVTLGAVDVRRMRRVFFALSRVFRVAVTGLGDDDCVSAIAAELAGRGTASGCGTFRARVVASSCGCSAWRRRVGATSSACRRSRRAWPVVGPRRGVVGRSLGGVGRRVGCAAGVPSRSVVDGVWPGAVSPPAMGVDSCDVCGVRCQRTTNPWAHWASCGGWGARAVSGRRADVGRVGDGRRGVLRVCRGLG